MMNSTFGLRADLAVAACSTPGNDAAALAAATVPRNSRRVIWLMFVIGRNKLISGFKSQKKFVRDNFGAMNNRPAIARNFHVLAKPVGPICNLDCKYCFYLEKEKLYPGESQWRMSDEVLEEYVR